MPSFEESLQEVDAHLEANPDDASAWNTKGVLLAKMESFGNALRSFDRAIRLNPDLIEAHVNRGRVLLALSPDKAHEALKSLDYALRIEPENGMALFDKASALRVLGRTKEEMACYKTLAKLNPKEWRIWMRMGDITLEAGEFSSAIGNYDNALQLDQNLVPALIHRAIALSMMEKWKEAIKSVQAATKLAPDDIETWKILGDVNLRAGKYKSAVKALKKAAQIDPHDASIENTLGMVSYRSGSPRDAIKHFKRATIRKKDHLSAWRNLGFMNMELEDWEEASAAWNRVTTLSKRDPDIFDAQAVTYARLGDFCSAFDAWDRARKFYRKQGNDKEVERVGNLGRAARINCARQKKAAKTQREKEKSARRFDDQLGARRRKQKGSR
ncbi:MAG: TPR domain-containing protein [Candidatus Thorarchaeota archaeon]